MVRYKVRISYDGHQFSGFQRQPHCRTVQEEIEKTLSRICSEKAISICGSGRTDRGVHALDQVIHFDLQARWKEEKLRFALDTQTPDDIGVFSVKIVPSDFHCRYTKHSKTYEYRVDIGRSRNPLMRHYATHFPYTIDLNRIQQAISKLVGEHDFSGFTASGSSVEEKIRVITTAKVEQNLHQDLLIFTFTGNGFLYKQVRNMVGTLLKIGNRRMEIEQIPLILSKKDRTLAGPTAPPNGLYLKEIHYEKSTDFSPSWK